MAKRATGKTATRTIHRPGSNAAAARADEEEGQDIERLRKVRDAVREVEKLLTEAEVDMASKKSAYFEAKKRAERLREDLRRVCRSGPDPQQYLPFMSGGDGDPAEASGEFAGDELDGAGADAEAAPPKKKARKVRR